MQKTCKSCGVEYTYNNESELKQFFYKKQSWYMNTCITCTTAHHRKMYATGYYNKYNKKETESQEQLKNIEVV